MKKGGGAGLGSVTLIMLFSILCLTVFAVLSLSSAKAELSLTERYVSSVEGFYEADAFATQIFSRLLGTDDLREEAGAIKRDLGFDIEVIESGGEVYDVSFTRGIDDTLSLVVELRFTSTNVDIKLWEIVVVSWELLDSADWNVNEKIEVWDGT